MIFLAPAIKYFYCDFVSILEIALDFAQFFKCIQFKRVCVGAGGKIYIQMERIYLLSYYTFSALCYFGKEYSPAGTNPAWPYLHKNTFSPSGLVCKKLTSNLGNWYTFNISPIPEETIERGFRNRDVSLLLYGQKNSQFIPVCS